MQICFLCCNLIHILFSFIEKKVFLLTIVQRTYLHTSFLISLIFASSHSLSFAFIIPSLRLLKQRLGTLALKKINKGKENMMLCHFKM